MASVQQLTQSILGGAASAASTSQSSTQTASKTSMDMNSFLTMFTTQLKYQDPTNPLQSYEMAAQLAQFSTVERLTQVNSTLKEMESYLSSMNNAQTIGLVGKQVTGSSNNVHVQTGSPSSLNFKLDAAAQVTVKVYDASNNLVRTVSLGSLNAGSQEFKWDGRNSAGNPVADGNYTCKVEAVDSGNKVLDVQTTVRGTVYEWRMQDGVPQLVLNGQDGVNLNISQITEVMAPAS